MDEGQVLTRDDLSGEQTIHAIADIRLLSVEEGGRHSPAYPLWRPQFYYDGHDWIAGYTFAQYPVLPGQAVETILRFANPEAHQGRLSPGTEFALREGSHTVARGTITWVHEALR